MGDIVSIKKVKSNKARQELAELANQLPVSELSLVMVRLVELIDKRNFKGWAVK